MAEQSLDIASIECRHRKEKKELQGQIQALKKAAKNDKSKKKELTADITRLESELESQHKKELDAAALNELAADTAEEANNEVTSPQPGEKTKMSKAQKRRDKKLQQDKEREAQIKLQEKENVNGPRNIESQAIISKLKKLNLKVFPIPSDGDCLYKAVAHQLTTKKQKSISMDELRKNVAVYIKDNKDDFYPFMSNPETCEMLSDVEFDEYCDNITSTKVWGGQLEIRALSNSLQCPISVIQATGPDSIEQGTEFEGPPLIITYHRHMYSLGEHYNSTCPSENIEETD